MEEYNIVITELNRIFENGHETDHMSSKFSYQHIEHIVPQINEFEFCDFIKYLLNEAHDALWINFMISMHLKLREIPCDDIISLFDSINLRFHQIVLLLYLCKYLEIDGELILENSKLEKDRKESLKNFLKNNRSLLKKTEKDDKIIQGFNLVTKKDLSITGKKLSNCLKRRNDGC